jgi:hypothetical protein
MNRACDASQRRRHAPNAQRPLHPSATADHGDLRRRGRAGDHAYVPAGAGLVGRRPPRQAPLEYSRGSDMTWVQGRLRIRDETAVTFGAPSRNSDNWIQLLARIAHADPTGPIRVVTDNLSSHTGGPIQAWLARHPRVQQVFISKAA